MDRFEAANVIRVFDFYLMCMALFSLLRRFTVYRDTLLILIAIRARWPRLANRLKQHHAVIVNWATLRPLALACLIMLVQLIASRLIFPRASLRVSDLLQQPGLLVVMILAVLPMLAIDCYFLIRVGSFDRVETEKYLDMAERWSGTFKARLVQVATFGHVNPDQMVDQEVRKNLRELGQTVNWSAWWVSAQAGARLLCGLVIWLLWATDS